MNIKKVCFFTIIFSVPLFSNMDKATPIYTGDISATARIIEDGEISLDTTNAILDFGTITVGEEKKIDSTTIGKEAQVFIIGKWKNDTIEEKKSMSSDNISNSRVKVKFPKNVVLTGKNGNQVNVDLISWCEAKKAYDPDEYSYIRAYNPDKACISLGGSILKDKKIVPGKYSGSISVKFVIDDSGVW